MNSRCPSATFLGRALLKGYGFDYVGSMPDWHGKAYATIEKCKRGTVWGALYDLDPIAERTLDKLENAPTDYAKIRVPVMRNDRVLQAMTYAANINMHKMPAKKYRDKVIKGADDRKLPRSYVRAYL